MCSVCVSVLLLSHTVLSEVYQEKLVTEDELKEIVKDMDLPSQLVIIQCTKPLDVAIKTADTLGAFGHSDEARKLRGW